MTCGYIIGIVVLAVAIFCFSGFIAYWFLVKRKMLRSLCKCVKFNEREQKPQQSANGRRASIVRKGKLEIVLIEGSLQSTSQQVPEQFRQKVDSVTSDQEPPDLPAPRTYSMKRQKSSEKSRDSATHRSTRADSDASANGPHKNDRSTASLGRQRPKVAAPPAPPKKPTAKCEAIRDSSEDERSEDDVEIIDNDIYGAA